MQLSKRTLILIAAAVILLLGGGMALIISLNAASRRASEASSVESATRKAFTQVVFGMQDSEVWPNLQGEPVYGSVRPDWVNLTDYVITPNVEVENAGVKVRVGRLLFDGRMMLMRLEIETPRAGARMVTDGRVFETTNLHVAGIGLPSNGDMIVYNEANDPDLTDNVMPVDVIFFGSDTAKMANDFMFIPDVRLLMVNLHYIDDRNAERTIEGKWDLMFTQPKTTPNGYEYCDEALLLQENALISFSSRDPFQINSLLTVNDIKLTNISLCISYSMPSFMNSGVGAPKIRMVDGSYFMTDFITGYYDLGDENSNEYNLYEMFDTPLDISQIKGIEIGDVLIPLK